MPTISRETLVKPVLPEAEFDLAGAGGTVRVRGMLLADRLKMLEAVQAAGEGANHVAHVLAATVVLDDGLPVYSIEDWAVYQAVHTAECSELFALAMRLNGGDAEGAEKK